MILGGYTFAWDPVKFTLPRERHTVLVGNGKNLVDVVRYIPSFIGKEIVLEWGLMREAQYQELRVLHKTNGNLLWDSVSIWVGKKSGIGTDYANPIGQDGQRFYHGLIGFLDYVTPIKKFDVGTYLSAWVPALGRYKYFVVIASGDFWADYRMESGLTGNDWYQIQPGDTVQMQNDPYCKTKSTIGIDPYLSAAKYPDPAHTQRIYYHKVSGADLAVGNYIYGGFSYLDYEVTGLGSGYADVIALDPEYGTTAQMVTGEALAPWYGSFSGVVDYIENLPIPEIDVEVTPRPDIPNYSVRTVSLDGKLLEVAGYEQPYRKDVKMMMSIRGVA